MVKISVIIPVYNMEQYLAESLESAERQTIRDELELICVNDGSKDSSLEILRDYESRYPNIVVIDQTNMGVAAARNNGMKAASGEFIAFLDPDDYYVKDNCLERMYEAAKAHGAKICGGSYSKDFGDRIQFRWDGFYGTKNNFEREEMVRYEDFQYDYGYYRYIFERKMIQENDLCFPLYIRYQDPPFFVRSMICAGEFFRIPDITYCYRFGHQNINWNEKRVCHLLCGLTDILRDSAEAGLKDLHKLELKRLRKDFAPYIRKNLHSPLVLNHLAAADAALRRDWTDEDPALAGGAMALVSEALARKEKLPEENASLRSKLEELREEAGELERSAGDERTALAAAEEERRRLEKEAEALKKELSREKKKNEDLKASVSYRFGRAVTGPGRKIRDVLKKH